MVAIRLNSYKQGFTVLLTLVLMLCTNENCIAQEESLDSILLAERAFTVLEHKCNTCHLERDPNKLFTKENMSKEFKKINRQVFIWKRMPQGKDHNLTKEETDDLKAWILFMKAKK